MKTQQIREKKSEKKWYLIDAEDQVLGRLSTKVANILRGKTKAHFSPQWDNGDFVIIINADKVKLTGNKETQKTYFKPSPGIGKSRHIPFQWIKDHHPDRIVKNAVKGMIPSGALGRAVYKKLFVYTGAEHPHAAQKPETIKI